jgi:hypothetical protein
MCSIDVENIGKATMNVDCPLVNLQKAIENGDL